MSTEIVWIVLMKQYPVKGISYWSNCFFLSCFHTFLRLHIMLLQ